MSQRDSQATLGTSAATLEISHAARSDSKVMRKIALLTFLFLPATFTSVSSQLRLGGSSHILANERDVCSGGVQYFVLQL